VEEDSLLRDQLINCLGDIIEKLEHICVQFYTCYLIVSWARGATTWTKARVECIAGEHQLELEWNYSKRHKSFVRHQDSDQCTIDRDTELHCRASCQVHARACNLCCILRSWWWCDSYLWRLLYNSNNALSNSILNKVVGQGIRPLITRNSGIIRSLGGVLCKILGECRQVKAAIAIISCARECFIYLRLTKLRSGYRIVIINCCCCCLIIVEGWFAYFCKYVSACTPCWMNHS
jgi:hypothetical protein